MRLIHVLTAAALVLLAAPAWAGSLAQSDSDYLTTAMQIANGRYALASYEQQHGSGAVKKLAASVEAQASRDSLVLDGLAKRYGITPEKGLLIQDKYHYSKLVGTTGAELDQRFAQELRISDNINLDTHKQEMQSGGSGTLKTYAKQHYAALQQELSALKHF